MQLSKIIFIGILWSVCAFACKKDAENKQPSGPYLWDYKNWNAADSISVSLNSSSFFGQPVSFDAIDSLSNPILIEVPSGGYYTQPHYILSFENNGGDVYELSAVSLNDDDVATMAAGGVNVIDGPNILITDPISQTFEFQYTVQILSPVQFRYIVDKYYR